MTGDYYHDGRRAEDYYTTTWLYLPSAPADVCTQRAYYTRYERKRKKIRLKLGVRALTFGGAAFAPSPLARDTAEAANLL